MFFADDGTPCNSPGFDVVIGNPPYVDIKALEDEMVDYIFKVFVTARQRVNIFAAFIERELTLARCGRGHVGAIIPTAFLTQVSYSMLRRTILTKGWLKNIVRLPNELFGAAAGEVKVDTCIIVVQNTAAGHIPTECLIYNSFQRVNKLSGETAFSAFDIPQQKWVVGDGTITLTDDREDKIIARMRHNSVRLDELCEFCLGLTPYDKYAGHTKEQIKTKAFHAKSRVDPTFKKLLLSGDVRRYEVEWNGEDWIKYGDWLAAPRQQRFFTNERILVQQIIDWSSLRILAGWTDDELYNTQNQFNLLARRGTDLKFVIAILNSKLISYYHRRAFLDVALQRFQKILIKDAKTFPFPLITFTTSAAKRSAQVKKGKRLHEKSIADGDTEDALHSAETELHAGRADAVHDFIAFLATRMIETKKMKRTTANRFQTDLKDFHGVDLRSMNPKTKLDQFWKLEPSDLFAHFRANKVRLTGSDEEKIRERFFKAKAAVTSLDSQIALTDRLIDQIVYRLYDLTPEEIKIVEGGSNMKQQ